MSRESAGIIQHWLFAGIFARHFDETTQWQQADLVVGIAMLETEQAGTKAERECFDANSAELGDDKVAKLMNHHHQANKNYERGCGN